MLAWWSWNRIWKRLLNNNAKMLSDQRSEIKLFTTQIERRQSDVDSMTRRIINTTGSNTDKVLADSNLSILGDMVKSLSKRAIKQQSTLDTLQNEVGVKDNVDASWRMISDLAAGGAAAPGGR
jgi:predicted  nucleic acid-binding Zn-ribbon protein